MGNLLTISIRTDAIHEMLENCEEFCKKVYGSLNNAEASSFGLGGHCNVADVQVVRHTDNPTTYVHMGGTLSEMNIYSEETERLMTRNPEFFEDMLKYMKEQVGELEKKFGETERQFKSDCGD